MKRTIPLLILLLCLPLCLGAQGKIYTPDNLPKVHIQNKYRYTCDPERILMPAATDSIDRMLYRLEQQTGIETVVAVVPSIGEATCFDFCHELLNSWGVGKKGKDRSSCSSPTSGASSSTQATVWRECCQMPSASASRHKR